MSREIVQHDMASLCNGSQEHQVPSLSPNPSCSQSFQPSHSPKYASSKKLSALTGQPVPNPVQIHLPLYQSTHQISGLFARKLKKSFLHPFGLVKQFFFSFLTISPTFPICRLIWHYSTPSCTVTLLLPLVREAESA